MENTVKKAVEHILKTVSSDIGFDLAAQKENLSADVEKLCSLASEISSGKDISFTQNRGLASVFDRLNLKSGQQPCGNILNYDLSKKMFLSSKTGGEPFEPSQFRSEFAKINSIDEWLDFLAKYTADIPCTKEGDMSVYEYARLSSAFVSALALYYDENKLGENTEIKSTKSFMLYTADFSGIQNFIYTIVNEEALKMLRAKSFFIELVMAQLTSEIVAVFGMTKANVLYSGGGHCYILLPNVKGCTDKLRQLHNNISLWSMENFGNGLSVIWETQECSPNDFMNSPKGVYAELFSGLSSKMAKKKLHKYSADEIIFMNETGADTDGKRECKVCGVSSRRVKMCTDKDECEWCSTFKRMSGIITDPQKCFAVLKNPTQDSASFFSYQGKAYFTFGGSDEMYRQIKDDNIIRIFCKNQYPSELIRQYGESKIIDVCDYADDDMLENLAESADGIKRLGVLRMDVDNLGSTFISGFDKDYMNIGRVAILSSQLTGFFKNNLNFILKKSDYNINVLYSGGDDVFLVGSWNHIISASMEIIREFKHFTGEKLSISGGIGLYKHKYPVARFAAETEVLEACSKNNPNHNKDSITLFSGDGTQTYSWQEFGEKVMEEKLQLLEQFIKGDNGKGNSFLYKLLEYLRGITFYGDKINIARSAYLLARMCSEIDGNNKQKEQFSKKIFNWINCGSESDRKQLITAVGIFVYKERSAE